MSSTVVLVTGANRGIGYAIIQALATAYPQHTYVLGVRSISNGETAISSLRTLGLTSTFDTVQIDITSDASIQQAVEQVQAKHGRLDVLVNNAAFAQVVKPGAPDFRDVCNQILDANVTSFVQVTHAFLPLLRASGRSTVINVSSARGSVHRQTNGQLPPSVVIPYTVSKTALNVTMLEMAKLEPQVLFQAVSPGHCKTAFNGFKGQKDPLDGAEVVVRLVGDDEKKYGMGFWEFEEGEMRAVPW